MPSDPNQPGVSYGELARLFLRLSLTAFGGPVAHIAMAENEIVVRRQWLTREHFLDLVAAVNLIPGPNSTEVMIHVGYRMRGIRGAILTGVCFIGPAFLLTLALSVIYVNTGSIPQVNALLWGIKPVIVAIIASAGYRLARAALRSVALWATFGAAVLGMALLNIPEVVVMLGLGAVYALLKTFRIHPKAVSERIGAYGGLLWLAALPLAQVSETAPTGLWDIFFYFLKIGSVLFGSGYVLIAYIQQDVVNTFGWLSTRQLLDAIAIGQITPGPVSTATGVVGYILAGLPGAVAATLGIFLPSFVLVILTAPLIPRMRRSALMGAFLSGVNAGVIAAILITLVDLAQVAARAPAGDTISALALGLGVGALFSLERYKINATWLIAVGAVVGLLAYR